MAGLKQLEVVKMKRYYFIFLIAFLSINQIHSAKFSYKGDCIYHPGFNDLSDCLDKELKEYDKTLNVLYKRLQDEHFDNHLKKSEQAWIQFKKADCDYMASEVNGGKEYSDIYTACLINRTKERINDLNRSTVFLKWFRGRL